MAKYKYYSLPCFLNWIYGRSAYFIYPLVAHNKTQTQTIIIMLLSSIQTIAKNNPFGFTIALDGLKPVESGYIVARPETQNHFNNTGLEKALKFACRNTGFMGGWQDTKTGRFYYDAVEVFTDLKEALKYGQLYNQIAIFDLNNMQEIRLK